jgi:hypothetical protein
VVLDAHEAPLQTREAIVGRVGQLRVNGWLEDRKRGTQRCDEENRVRSVRL